LGPPLFLALAYHFFSLKLEENEGGKFKKWYFDNSFYRLRHADSIFFSFEIFVLLLNGAGK
jgi:hypothetical protein